MKSVYIVAATYHYEGYTVMHAYTRREDAQAFADACTAYHNSEDKPQAPKTLEDTPENDAEHEKWWAELNAWEEKHPAPEFTHCDGFTVMECEVRSEFHAQVNPVA